MIRLHYRPINHVATNPPIIVMIGPLTALRRLMAQHGVAAYLLPRTDQYQSEYLAPSDERVAFLSGFTGSHAIALICQQRARLYTDGRYWIQAEQ